MTTAARTPAAEPAPTPEPPAHDLRHARWRRLAGCAALALLVAAAALLALTRTGRFLVRAAYEEGRILARRRPIEAIVADPSTSPRARAKLRLVLDARRFAVDSLHLDAGRSFTRFSDIGRDTLVLVLSAARRDRLLGVGWWFPVVGRVPYKGFFDFGAARAEAARMRERGLDTYLRPSSAFSTLGWFEDPLLSTALRADSADLANTVVHELTHNTFYAPGQAVFNESFASFVGARGAERFFAAHGDTLRARLALGRWGDEKVLGTFWRALAASIDSAFAAHPGESSVDSLARVLARDTVYARARLTLADSVAPQLSTVPTPARAAVWARRIQLDNAALLARRIYARELPLFDSVYAREGGDLRRAVTRVVTLAKSRPKDPYGALRDWVAGAPTAAPPPGGG
jgi:predicted aminopeptidase